MTNPRGYTGLSAPKTKGLRKEEGSKGGKPGMGLSCPLFAF